MVVAPIVSAREPELRGFLGSMNRRPGVVDPDNELIPFAKLERLHFARIVILSDQTGDDIACYRVPTVPLPTYLAFLADCDGPANTFLEELVQRAGGGLSRLFSHCEGFSAEQELLQWMRDHEQPPATAYVNWMGRTMTQVREERALHAALRGYLENHSADLAGMGPHKAHQRLKDFVQIELQANRLRLTPPEPTPLDWQLLNLLHLVGVPIVVLVLTPLFLIYLPLFVWLLRRKEADDPIIAPRTDPTHVRRLAELEDHDACNQFTAMGSLKPGLFRRLTLSLILALLDYTTRHIYNHGRLARVITIHFARWVFLPDRKRLLFASNYDGSLESYMDDFINKAAFGLNLVFSNGVGYPATRWLVLDGAKDEQKFKYFIRRHQLPTQVWYNAQPGLTALDRALNTRIREGLEKRTLTDDEARNWMSMI